MFNWRKQKFCDECSMPVEMCECESCENCGKSLNDCNCEVCVNCSNFVEYCECSNKENDTSNNHENTAEVEPKGGVEVCVDCGFHNTECKCDNYDEENVKNNVDEGSEESLNIDEHTINEEEKEVEVVYIEEPPTKAVKVWRFTMTSLVLLTVGLVLGIGYFAYTNLFTEPEKIYLTPNEKYDLTLELLTLMYNARDVQDIINNQESVMSKVTPELYPKFDVSNQETYLNRYGSFSNSEITIEFNNYTKSVSDNQIIVNYTIKSQADYPSRRMAIVEFNNDKMITSFSEYSVNEIN